MAIERKKWKKPTDEEMLEYWQSEKRRFSKMKDGVLKRDNLKVINNAIQMYSDKIAAATANKPAAQRSQASRSTNVVKPRGEAAAPRTGANAQSRKAAPKTSPAFTVMAGRKSKTFATKKEAREYEKAVKRKTGKAHAIRESTRKPTHRIVRFTAKK